MVLDPQKKAGGRLGTAEHQCQKRNFTTRTNQYTTQFIAKSLSKPFFNPIYSNINAHVPLSIARSDQQTPFDLHIIPETPVHNCKIGSTGDQQTPFDLHIPETPLHCKIGSTNPMRFTYSGNVEQEHSTTGEG